MNDYTYDANGNMTRDRNKGIHSITYNMLNLPQTIVFNDGHETRYTYAADGRMSEQTESTIIGSSHPITAGYLYDGSLELNENTKIPYAQSAQANEYKISTSGSDPYIIKNVRITPFSITWDYQMLFISDVQYYSK